MSQLTWDAIGEHFYETGIDKVVLYPLQSDGSYSLGVAWNGVSNISENPSGAEANPLYADNIKYLNIISTEDFGATIEAYTYPDEFAACDGSSDLTTGVRIGQQKRSTFGLAYRTRVGNDIDGSDHGYKLHMIYGAVAAPSEKGYSTISDSPEAITFSWELSTTPVEVDGYKPTSTVTIDSTKVSSAVLSAIEDIIYGTELDDPYLPLPDEIMEIIEANTSSDSDEEEEEES